MGGQHVLRSKDIPSSHQDVEIDELPEGHVPVDGRGQDRSLVGNREDPARLEQAQQLEELGSQGFVFFDALTGAVVLDSSAP